MPTLGKPPFRPTAPGALWKAVLSARGVLAEQRREPLGGPRVAEAREGLLDALEAYAASLVADDRPIPYLLRDELRIQRRTLRPIIAEDVLADTSPGARRLETRSR